MVLYIMYAKDMVSHRKYHENYTAMDKRRRAVSMVVVVIYDDR